ncbi:MAG: helix-turn-helix domain-containing protein [Candidatus Hydrogenedentes bacterium]|nr:helix-turn-helix domain-containing protein [Candidatus Hydrogenedentota bacterium]
MSDTFETVPPTKAEQALALESSQRLAAHKIGRHASVRIQLVDDEAKETITMPRAVLELLRHALSEMAQGNAVTLIPTNAELTTQQAADLLNVSRPYVVKLLDEKKIPSRMVGKYRRLRFDDLMAYKQKDDDARAMILDQLSAETQELGIV